MSKNIKIISIISGIIIVLASVFAVLYSLDVFESIGVSDEEDDSDKEKRKSIRGLMKEKGGSVIVFEAQADNPTNKQMDTVTSIMRKRLDGLGYSEATVTRQGEKEVRIEIPGITEPYREAETLGQTAQISFVDCEGKVVLTGADIKTVDAEYGETGEMGSAQNYISLEFNEEGAKKFAEATERITNLPEGQNQIAIMLDDMVISAPRVQSRIDGGKAVITGDFTAETAKEYAAVIKSGQLPFTLSLVSVDIVSPTK